MTGALHRLIAEAKVYDLGRPLFIGMPQSPNHPPYYHTLPRRHGDMVRPDGSSAANDMITMGTHVGTHIDALAHVSYQGKLHGDVDVEFACNGGRFMGLGVHTIEPIVRRGVLLDIPRLLGRDCPPGYEITVADLEAACSAQRIEVAPGDVALIRSGWGKRFDEGALSYLGHDAGVPGISAAGAGWLRDKRVHAAGADTVAFERLAPASGHSLLPAHNLLLVEAGIYIVEALDLEGLAHDRVDEFIFVLSPLKLMGATGSPVRPLALVS